MGRGAATTKDASIPQQALEAVMAVYEARADGRPRQGDEETGSRIWLKDEENRDLLKADGSLYSGRLRTGRLADSRGVPLM